MALGIIGDPNGLSQGASTTVSDIVFADAGVGQSYRVRITSAGTNIPDNLLVGEWIEIRDHSDAVNNGLYQVQAITAQTSNVTLDKVSGSDPVNEAVSESAFVLTSTYTSIATDLAFTADVAPNVQITGTAMPAMVVGERFTVSNFSVGSYNGSYEVVTVNTSGSDYLVKSLTGDTGTQAGEAADIRTTIKNVMWDTAALKFYLLEDATSEDGTMDLDGVRGQPFYSKAVLDWKNDAFLIANAPFPLQVIDSDAGKSIFGQDPSGNFSGWAPQDNSTFSIRTRKMLRNLGWEERTSAGVLSSVYSGIRTLGAFLDETASTGDQAYYQFGNDVATNTTSDFTFTGPVNEAVASFMEIGNPDTFTFVDGAGGDDTCTRATGSFITDGFVVGGQMTVRAATTAANDGTYTITGVAALTLTFATGTFDTGQADSAAQIAVDNRNAVTLRLRERTTTGNTNARTYSQADLASAGETVLSNRLFTFGLANGQDLDITESDANIDANDPYDNMTITYHATPQSRGNNLGGGDGLLVGGPYNFGIIVNAQGSVSKGTNTEVYEWTNRQLRRTATDAAVDSSTKIGRSLDGLMKFVGPTLEVGSTDSGLSFPTNPDGGGSGVYINNLNAASTNDTVFFDNLGTKRTAPLVVPVTLNFNQTGLDDANYTYTLYFDYTRRTTSATLTDLIITAGTGADGTFGSVLTNLPSTDAQLVVGDYVRVSGLTAGDAAMNGIYQLTAETTPNTTWAVTRYDGATIVTTSSAAANLDEHPIDSPDFIIVDDNTNTDVTGSDPSAAVQFSFDYSNNTQGGRSGGTDAQVIARAIGQDGAQYAQSALSTIGSSAVTIAITSGIERNFLNP